MSDRPRSKQPEHRDKAIKACKDWLARRKAELDQLEKRYEAQYDIVCPETNLRRLENIEALRFWVSIHEWELQQMIEAGDEQDWPIP